MKATYHLAKRFLERVLKKAEFNEEEIYKIQFYLNNVLQKLQVRSSKGYVVMPDFNKYVLAYNEGVATTILEKEWVKEDLMYMSNKINKKEFSKIKTLKKLNRYNSKKLKGEVI